MITSIKLNEKQSTFKTDDAVSINGLNKINIFIGANNSGKSRFLRTLFNEDYEFKINSFDSEKFASLINEMKKEVLLIVPKNPNVIDIRAFVQELSEIPDFSFINKSSKIISVLNTIIHLANTSTTFAEYGNGNNPHDIIRNATTVIKSYQKSIEEILKDFETEHSPGLIYRKVYLPVLRGLKPLQSFENRFDIGTDNYQKRVLKDYFKNKPIGILEIFTGLDLYKRVTSLLLGESKDRQKIRDFESYLSKTFFDNNEVNIVPREGHDVLNIKIGNEERPIYDLGDGIQSIILLTYPLFFNIGTNTLFHIEEPETHLHPGLQRIFIETLKDPRFSSFQYFITTHSNHFLDLSLEYDDISIYSFQKESESIYTINTVCDNHMQLLDLLGVRNSSVFLANCTIWVEGITDRIYLRKYIELLQKNQEKKYKEDLHFSFIEYAGNNITHWSFLDCEDENHPNINYKSISSKIFLIADSDGVDIPHIKGKEKKQKRLEFLKAKLGENFYATGCLEIENMLSKEIIVKVIEHKEDKNLDFSSFNRKSHTQTPLGEFIENNIENLKKKYKSDSGTIYNKLEFCKKAVSHINSFEDLSDEAKILTHKIYDFIKKSNPS